MEGLVFLAGLELLEVLGGEVFQRGAEFVGQLGDVPQHIAEFGVEALDEFGLRGERLVAAEDFFDFFYRFAAFTCQAEGEIGEGLEVFLAGAGIDGGGLGLGLIGLEGGFGRGLHYYRVWFGEGLGKREGQKVTGSRGCLWGGRGGG